MEWLPVGISILILVFNIIVAIITYRTVYRHRVVFGIKTECLRMPNGTRADMKDYTTVINDILNSGNYTILGMVERSSDKDMEIIFGQIKENNQ